MTRKEKAIAAYIDGDLKKIPFEFIILLLPRELTFFERSIAYINEVYEAKLKISINHAGITLSVKIEATPNDMHALYELGRMVQSFKLA